MTMEKRTEIIIVVFIVICIFLILFEIFHSLKMKNREKKIEELLKKENIIEDLLMNPYKFKNETNLLAFELCFDKEKSDDVRLYLDHILKAKQIFTDLIINKEIKDDIVKSYVVYLATKYKFFYLTDNEKLKDELIYLVGDKNIYVRENALKCIYGIGDENLVLEALLTLQSRDIHHNRKLLHDGLLEFMGEGNQLADLLLSKFEDFNTEMQVTLATYFRFQTDEYCEEFLEWLKDDTRDKELRISALRYLQKYPYKKALPYIVELASPETENWEYRAIAATCLGSYHYKESIDVLKKSMSDSVWYVRKNAAESLIKLNVTQRQMSQILKGDDEYAKEQLQYKLDEKTLKLEAKTR